MILIGRGDCEHCHGTGIRIGGAVYNHDKAAYTFTVTMPCGCVDVKIVRLAQERVSALTDGETP